MSRGADLVSPGSTGSPYQKAGNEREVMAKAGDGMEMIVEEAHWDGGPDGGGMAVMVVVEEDRA